MRDAALSLCVLAIPLFAQWESPVLLTTQGNPARIWANNGWFLSACSSGTLQAIWWDNRDANPAIYGKRSTDEGTTWLADRNLSSDPESTWCPSLAAAGNYLHLVYKDKHGGWGAFYRRSTDAGATWSAETALARFASPIGGSMTDATWGSTVHVLWAVFHGAHTQISYCRSLDRGASWQPEVLLTNDTARSEDPCVAVTGSTVHVVWFGTSNGPGNIYYKRSLDNGTTWGPETRLTGDSAIVYAPTIVVRDSVVHIAWIDRRSGGYDFQVYYMRSSDAGTTWGPETRLTDIAGSCLFPVLAVTRRDVHICWYDNRNGINQLYYRHSSDTGQTWDPELRLTQTRSNSSNPAIALTGDTIHIAFCDDSTGVSQIWYLRNPGGSSGITDRRGVGRGTRDERSGFLTPRPSPLFAGTIVRNVLDLPTEPGISQHAPWFLLDITGRSVARLHSGRNDVSFLRAGIYFLISDRSRQTCKIAIPGTRAGN